MYVMYETCVCRIVNKHFRHSVHKFRTILFAHTKINRQTAAAAAAATKIIITCVISSSLCVINSIYGTYTVTVRRVSIVHSMFYALLIYCVHGTDIGLPNSIQLRGNVASGMYVCARGYCIHFRLNQWCEQWEHRMWNLNTFRMSTIDEYYTTYQRVSRAFCWFVQFACTWLGVCARASQVTFRFLFT